MPWAGSTQELGAVRGAHCTGSIGIDIKPFQKVARQQQAANDLPRRRASRKASAWVKYATRPNFGGNRTTHQKWRAARTASAPSQLRAGRMIVAVATKPKDAGANGNDARDDEK